MAHFASFNTDGWMLKSERAALIGVAFQTGFFIAKRLRDKRRPCRHPPCRRECTMWIVTIGACHKAGVYRVFKRHRKVGPNVGVASITEFRLGFG
jgi:hypothetical protein